MSLFKHRMLNIIIFSMVSGILTILLALSVSGYLSVGSRLDLGIVKIQFYSITIIAAFMTGIGLFGELKKRERSLDKLDPWDAALYLLVPGIVGARIYHVLTDFHLYQNDLVGALEIWNGGLGFIGGIVGGALGLAWYLRKNKFDVTKILPILVIVVPISQAIGRLGNFFNKELFGLPTDAPWGQYISPQSNPFVFLRDYSFFHPIFLYEALANIALAAFLYSIWQKGTHYSTVIISYVTGYGVIRFTLDFLRVDGRTGFWYLSYAQWLVIGWLLFAVTFGIGYQIWHKRKHGKWFTKKE